jgi:hypothetical protein
VLTSETVFALLLAAAARGAASAPEPAIQHDPPACVLADHPARIGACLPLGSPLRAGRLHFRDAARTHWYDVDLIAEGSCLWGTLPSPQRRLRRVSYFLDLTGGPGITARTPERLVRVVGDESDCAGGAVAPVDVAEPPFVTASGGAPLTPEGFGPRGGRAVPWIAGLLVAGGAGGTAAVLAGAAGGGAPAPREPATPTPDTTPGPTPTPVPTFTPAPPTPAPPGPRPTSTPEPEPPAPPPPPPPPTTAPTPTPRATPTGTATATPTPGGPTPTPPPPTATPTGTATSTPTATPTGTGTATPTATPPPTATATPTATSPPTATPTPAPTTPPPTPTPAPSPTSTPTPPGTPTPRPGFSEGDDGAFVQWRALATENAARLRVIVGGRVVAEAGRPLEGRVGLPAGDNVVEVQWTEGRPARVELSFAGRGFVRGTLRLLNGRGIAVGPDSVSIPIGPTADHAVVVFSRRP